MSSANLLQPLFAGRGFIVQDLFLATGGQLLFPPIYEVGQVAAPGAPRDVMGARFGIDLRFPGDFTVLPNEDLELTTGSDGVRGALTRALITEPGEIYWRTGYGVGLLSLLNLPVNAALLAEIKRRIRSSFEGEADVERLERLEVTAAPSGDLVEVEVRVRLVGTAAQDVGVRIRRAA